MAAFKKEYFCCSQCGRELVRFTINGKSNSEQVRFVNKTTFSDDEMVCEDCYKERWKHINPLNFCECGWIKNLENKCICNDDLFRCYACGTRNKTNDPSNLTLTINGRSRTFCGSCAILINEKTNPTEPDKTNKSSEEILHKNSLLAATQDALNRLCARLHLFTYPIINYTLKSFHLLDGYVTCFVEVKWDSIVTETWSIDIDYINNYMEWISRSSSNGRKLEVVISYENIEDLIYSHIADFRDQFMELKNMNDLINQDLARRGFCDKCGNERIELDLFTSKVIICKQCEGAL